MPILRDGTVVPSFLGVESGGFNGNYAVPNNFALRYGEVKEVILPNSKSSQSGQFIEYKVEVQHSDGAEGGTTSTYVGVALSTLFGGLADRVRYTLRADTTNSQAESGVGTGSKVLLLCINGQDNNAIILGGVEDHTFKEAKHASDEGHYFEFQFNGCSFKVNDAGEVELQYKGKTKVNNELDDSADAEASGSKILLDKEGSITLATKDNKELVKIDHKSNKIVIEVQDDGKIEMKSGGVLVGDAQENWLLAKTYRDKESKLHNELANQLQSIATDIGQVAAKLAAVAVQHAYPVAGPVAAAPTLASAATSLGATVTKFLQAVAALKQFEAQAPDYLSTKNFND